ncbi:hypothetical protein GCM10009817_34560 [Terrabacter lapilli]|uniref:Fibronectin type-III domain-containing protein n=1 Tax=Terrabacter lapilli TaxID=436231 RepID=A0ABN2SNS7_9MICO
MHFCAQIRTRLAALLAVGLAATTVAVTAPAAWAVDDASPRLDSISFTTPIDVVPGDPVTISYSATDASTTVRIVAYFVDGTGRRTEWHFGDQLPLAGVASTTVPDGLANGVTRLSQLTVTDAEGRRTLYSPTGMTCLPACPDAVHDLPLNVTLSVTGSTPDVQAPVLRSVSLASTAAAVGQVARLDLGVDELHPALTSEGTAATAEFTNGHEIFRLNGDPAAYGSVIGAVPMRVPNGTYWLDSVSVRDLPGNSTTYRSSGAVAVRPSGAVGPTSHTLPFTATTITVTGSSVDGDSPVLSSMAYGQAGVVSGTTGSISFVATEQALDTVRIEYTSTDGSQSPAFWGWETKVTGPGVASGVVPAVSTGRWNADTVVLRDRTGNYSAYHRDGTLECNRSCPTTHTLDLAALDLTVIARPEAPWWVGATASERSARVQWDPPGDTGGSAVTGYTVTVSPGGRTYTVGATTRALTVPGLTNNTTYTFSVRAGNAAGLGPTRTTTAIPRARQRLFVTVDVSNDRRADIIGVTRGNIAYIYRGNGAGGIAGATRVGSGLGELRALLPALAQPNDDFFGGNTLAITDSGRDESWWAYNGNRLTGANSILPGRFNAYRQVVTPGDFNGNTKADVITIADNGDMFLWVNKDWAHFYTPKKIGSGWQSFTAVVGVGDFDGDRRNDLVARRSDGTLWLYPGNGSGGFRPRKQIGAGWNVFAQITGMGDFTGDRRNDVLALAPNGYLYAYPGNGRGGFSPRFLVSKGFASFV